MMKRKIAAVAMVTGALFGGVAATAEAGTRVGAPAAKVVVVDGTRVGAALDGTRVGASTDGTRVG